MVPWGINNSSGCCSLPGSPLLNPEKHKKTVLTSAIAFQHREKWYVIYRLVFKHRLTQLLRVLIMQSVIGSLEWKVEVLNQNHKLSVKYLKVVLLLSTLCNCSGFRVIRVIPCAFKILFQCINGPLET